MKNFLSATDNFFKAILTIVSFLVIASAIVLFFFAFSLAAIVIAAILFIVAGLAAWIIRSIRYERIDNYLVIKFGPFKKKVDLRNVNFVTDKYSSANSPSSLKIGGSNKTITLQYSKEHHSNKYWISITPVNETKFLQEIMKRSPDAKFELTRLNNSLEA